MGCLKEKAITRQEKGEKIHFYAFDCLAYAGKSWMSYPAKKRFAFIDDFGIGNEYTTHAHYVSGADLNLLLQEILARGDEGVVITHKDGLYEPGKRPSKTTLKIKKELKNTIDCFFTGRTLAATKEYTGKEIETWTYWQNEKTGEKMEGDFYKNYSEGSPIIPITKGHFYGWAGSLEIAVFRKKSGSKCKVGDKVYENIEVFPIGYLSGLTEEIKAHPAQYAFKPLEVTAMEIDKIACTLRHGKLIGFRNDLTIEDCTYDKLMGL
jgi:ATP-dependent DNA ligase